MAADLHFGDAAIIRYERRPWKSVGEMDEALVSNWNAVVCSEDTVFVLGDFSIYGREKTKQLCERLRGHKILICGNHDQETSAFYRECGFEEVSHYPIVFQQFWLLSHEPLYVNENMPYANIYGHVHKNSIYRDASKQSFCVCVERIGYTPIDFEQITCKIKELGMSGGN